MIVGISGYPGTGKDTMASRLKIHNFTRVSLADKIRHVAMMVTGVSFDAFLSHPRKDESLECLNNRTPRQVTVEIGRAIESVVGNSAWTNAVGMDISRLQLDKVVVPDIRTEQQANWIKERKGLLVRIHDDSGYKGDPIEHQLDNYQDWDLVVTKEKWFSDPNYCMSVLLELIDNNTVRRKQPWDLFFS